MNIFERQVGGRWYRVASQSLWDPARQRPFARQAVLGPADAAPVADLGSTRTIGTRRVGDVGALIWVAEQLDLIKLIDQACGLKGPTDGPTIGEMVLAVAVQRACAPAAKCHLAAFLESCVPRVSCLPASAFTGQGFHRLASQVTDDQLEKAQIEIARAAVRRFELATDVLAFDTTNFDTHIATTTPGELARRGKAKSKRSDLRVVGLAALVSETGHVPLLHRTYPGNGSDQTVLEECLEALGKLHDALNDARRGAMKRLGGKLGEVRAARLRIPVGDAKLDRTLVVVESQELLRGQKRGIAVALRKAKEDLRKLERRVASGRIQREALEDRVQKALQREHLSKFVIATVKEGRGKVSLHWRVDPERRRLLERTRLGRRVLCTERHTWSNGRIAHAFRGQWKVEELFRRAKKGGVAPWGPSHQRADNSLRLHTFATVIGLTLVSLVSLALGTRKSAQSMMKALAEVKATLVRVRTKERGRRATVMLAPDLTAEQRKSVKAFELGRWMPILLSSRSPTVPDPDEQPSA